MENTKITITTFKTYTNYKKIAYASYSIGKENALLHKKRPSNFKIKLLRRYRKS